MVETDIGEACINAILAADARYADPGKHLTYGTAGFRAKASLLNRASFRVGLVVAMRAKYLGNTCGVMVTASHNHHVDNGVKIIEPDGSMLVHKWEEIAEMLVNSQDLGGFIQAFSESDLFEERNLFQNQANDTQSHPHVFLARDTRESSPVLIAAVKEGLTCLNVSYTDFDLMTTP